MFARIRGRLNTALLDLRFGGRLLKGSLKSNKAHLGSIGIEHSLYSVLDIIFRDQIRHNDVLVDIGCGKGRVLNWWLAHYRDHQMYGIEWEEFIAEQTRHRLRKYENVKILTGDACSLIPDEGSLFYLNNPFKVEVMQRFIPQLLKHSRSTNGLTRRVIYFNCVCIDLFRDRQNFIVHDLPPIPKEVHPYQPPCAFIELV